MNKNEKITFRVPERLKHDIVRYAKIKGISSGELIRSWIELIINNQILNFPDHYYQTEDGKCFSDMKTLCNELQISSHTARKRIKSGLIKKITIDPNHANKYGDENVRTTRSRTIEKDRIQV